MAEVFHSIHCRSETIQVPTNPNILFFLAHGYKLNFPNFLAFTVIMWLSPNRMWIRSGIYHTNAWPIRPPMQFSMLFSFLSFSSQMMRIQGQTLGFKVLVELLNGRNWSLPYRTGLQCKPEINCYWIKPLSYGACWISSTNTHWGVLSSRWMSTGNRQGKVGRLHVPNATLVISAAKLLHPLYLARDSFRLLLWKFDYWTLQHLGFVKNKIIYDV